MARWGLPSRDALANSPEVFEGDAASGALSLRHDAFADGVVDGCPEAPFLAPAPFEQPPGRTRAFGLQALAQSTWPMPQSVEVPADCRRVPSLSVAMLMMPEIDTQVRRWARPAGGSITLHRGVQKPVAVAIDEIGLTLPLSQQHTLALAAHERDRLDGRPTVQIETLGAAVAQDAVVVGEAAKRREHAVCRSGRACRRRPPSRSRAPRLERSVGSVLGSLRRRACGA